MPSAVPTWLPQLGWWTVVMVLMGLLVLVVVHTGFSEEPAAAGELIVRFHDGALRYPDGAPRALLHQVQFHPMSLQRLNARYGLVAVERVMSQTQATQRMFRLVFASRVGLERVLTAYRHDPYVISAELVDSQSLPANRVTPFVRDTRDA